MNVSLPEGPKRGAQTQAQVHLRMPPMLYERIKVIASEQGVSINQAIVLLLTSTTAGFQFEASTK